MFWIIIALLIGYYLTLLIIGAILSKDAIVFAITIFLGSIGLVFVAFFLWIVIALIKF